MRLYEYALATAFALAVPSVASAQSAPSKPLAGATIRVASMNDPFAGVLVRLAPKFEAETGAKVIVDVLSYPELLGKITADFVGNVRGFDVVTMDIVWAGQFAEANHTVDLAPFVARDRAELDLDDIYPVAMNALGRYEGRQIAWPFAGYANVLTYRKDLFQAKGLAIPKTVAELRSAAIALTDRSRNVYGFVANGQKGPAAAQDWMQYNAQLGGSILDAQGRPALNSERNVESLRIYKDLFDQAAPPGAVNYDWDGREMAFRQGLAATQQNWSAGASAYDDPQRSKVVGLAGIALAPTADGLRPRYGFGGWGLAINADIDEKRREAAWIYMKWITSAAIQKEAATLGFGGWIRRSTVQDPDLNKLFPFLPVIHESFENGDGDYRPRIPQYPQIQDILGTAVNAVLVTGADPKQALDRAQTQALRLF